MHYTSERVSKEVQKGHPEAVAIAHPDLRPVDQRSHIGAQGLCICMQVNQDQRAVTHQHEHHSQVNQDQRSFTHNQDQRVLQVTLGVSPEHVIEREATIISQAHAAVREARCQSASEITAMRNQVSEVHHQAQSHVHSIERRAHDLIQDLQLKHQSEMDQMQAVANDAHRISQEQLNQAMNENASLMQTIHDQSVQLRFQKDEQREMRSVIQGLQEQVDLLRTSQPQPQNGAVNDRE